MVMISLTRNKIALVCECHLEVVQDYKWHFDSRYAATHINGKKVYMHRLIRKGKEIDHINRNKLDNQCTNLRSVNRSQNMLNAPLRKDSQSGHKGITILNNGRYRARAYGRYLGIFGNLTEALNKRKEILK